jgi:hypothetical protein
MQDRPGQLAGHELIGERRLGAMPSSELVDLWIRITSAIVKHGFAIEYRDLEPPRTGTFNGLRIHLDPDVGFEMQCFILLHLFGHSVQWVAPTLEASLDELQNTDSMDVFLTALRRYEFEAACLGMQLMHDAGVTTLDQWYSDFVETDWRYVKRFYLEGSVPEWSECMAHNCEIIAPVSIPELKHREVEIRFAF